MFGHRLFRVDDLARAMDTGNAFRECSQVDERIGA
jgi:hypothetical protein